MSNEYEGDFLDLAFREMALRLDDLQKRKGLTYKDSWRKRDAIGIWMNVCRKFDRAENVVEKAAKGYGLDPARLPEGEESLEETLGDLAVYVIKMLTFLEWKKKQRAETGERRLTDKRCMRCGRKLYEDEKLATFDFPNQSPQALCPDCTELTGGGAEIT